jgi:hypothetical protein
MSTPTSPPEPLLTSIRSFCEPQANGLPNLRVLLYPLVIVGLVFIAAVATGVTGSSTGFLNQFVNTERDPNLLSGEAQAIRSDEWYVQTSWTISQVEQGLPGFNDSFPGGMDATVQHDLPSTDWSVAFRPHLLGFLFLPLDNAMAWKWWMPAFAMIAATFVFAVTLLPRRPATASFLAFGFFFAPFFQWWFLSISFWPVAWAMLVMAGTVWLLKSDGGAGRVVFPLLVGYVAVTTAMGIYVPFIIPATLVALAFAVGFTLSPSSSPTVGTWPRLKRLKWIFIAGAAAATVLAVWLATRWESIQGFTSTVYPGERLQTVGTAGLGGLESLMAGVFAYGAGKVGGVPYDFNSSEASTFILVGLFLVVPLLWLVLRRRKGERRDPLIIALLALLVLLLAYYFVPGWDAVAHALLLDRSTIGRMRLAFGMLSIVMIVVLIAGLDRRREAGSGPVPVWISIVTLGCTLLVNSALAFALYRIASPIFYEWFWYWFAAFVLFAVAVWFFSRGLALIGSAAFLVMSLIGGSWVNPLYAGVYDLNGTSLLRTMKSINEKDPGQWVGVGEGMVPTVALVQSGLESYNGFQSSPSDDMWKHIDPTGADEIAWNRLANVSWGPGEGPPNPRNPHADQIRLTFDSCDDFAQHNVDYVLADVRLNQDCATLVKRVRQGPSVFWMYRVV